MSDNEGSKAGAGNGKGRTDRQRLAYYFNLVEYSNVKLDFANAPRPDGKSAGACRIMIDRLKGTLKTELATLRGVDEADVSGGTPKKTPTTRKRKAKGETGDGGAATEGEVATPTKRGRKKKVVEKEDLVGDKDGGDNEELTLVKPEPKTEEVEDEVLGDGMAAGAM